MSSANITKAEGALTEAEKALIKAEEALDISIQHILRETDDESKLPFSVLLTCSNDAAAETLRQLAPQRVTAIRAQLVDVTTLLNAYIDACEGDDSTHDAHDAHDAYDVAMSAIIKSLAEIARRTQSGEELYNKVQGRSLDILSKMFNDDDGAEYMGSVECWNDMNGVTDDLVEFALGRKVNLRVVTEDETTL